MIPSILQDSAIVEDLIEQREGAKKVAEAIEPRIKAIKSLVKRAKTKETARRNQEKLDRVCEMRGEALDQVKWIKEILATGRSPVLDAELLEEVEDDPLEVERLEAQIWRYHAESDMPLDVGACQRWAQTKLLQAIREKAARQARVSTKAVMDKARREGGLLKEKLEVSRRRVGELERRVRRLEDANQRLASEVENLPSYKRENDNLKKERMKTNHQVDMLRSRCARLESDLRPNAEDQVRLQAALSKVAELQNKLNKAYKAMDALRRPQTDADVRTLVAQQTADRLQDRLLEAHEALGKLRGENARLQAENARLEIHIDRISGRAV